MPQPVFGELQSIFAHYAKGATGGETAEDAVEMTMTEFKKLVKDVGLETKDFKFDGEEARPRPPASLASPLARRPPPPQYLPLARIFLTPPFSGHLNAPLTTLLSPYPSVHVSQ